MILTLSLTLKILKLKHSFPRVAIVSTFPPTQCGIATYSSDLLNAINSIHPEIKFLKVNLATSTKNDYSLDYQVNKESVIDFRSLARFINSDNIDLLDIQHEFKIYGSPDGENIIEILNTVKKPITATLHTVTPNLSLGKSKVFENLVGRCDLLYVFSNESKEYIINKFKKADKLIKVIPHGVPTISYLRKEQSGEKKPLTNKVTFISAGLLRSSKGYENALYSLYNIKPLIPDFKYIILGVDHPENPFSKNYREDLLSLVKKLGLEENVMFINSYLSTKEIIEYVQFADVALLPYAHIDQSSSGVLPLMIACGRPVVSTPFQFATTIIKNESGVIASSFSQLDFQKSIEQILKRESEWQDISNYNFQIAKSWSWNNIADKYVKGYQSLLEVNYQTIL